MNNVEKFGQLIKTLSQSGVRVEALIEGRSEVKVEVKQKPNYDRREEQGENEQGEYVLYFPEQDIYLKTIGELDSYGSEETFPLGYGYLVEPTEKMVTVYE